MLRLAGATWSRFRPPPTRTPTTMSDIPAVWPRRWRAPSRTGPSGPISSTTWPTARPMSRRPDPRSGSRPTARSTGSSARWAPAARWRAWRTRCSPRASRSALRSRRRGPAFVLHHREFDSPGSSITEGIGQGRITANLEGFTPDYSWRIPDEEALPIVFDLLKDEGLCLGGSSGINIAGAIRMAREMGRPYDRHHPVRLRNPLSDKAVQPRLFCAPRAFRTEWLTRPAPDLPQVYED